MKNKLIIIAMMLILPLSVVFSQVIDMGQDSVLDASTGADVEVDAQLQSGTPASVEATDVEATDAEEADVDDEDLSDDEDDLDVDEDLNEDSKFGRELGECIKGANEEDEDFGHCFNEFSKEVAEHVANTLMAKNKNANQKILKALERFQGKAGKRLGNLMSDLEDFNLSGIDADEVVEELEGLSEEEVEEKIEDIKDKSTKDKFAKGLVPFKDTDDQDWFYYFVDRMDQEKCITGFTDEEGNPLGEFRPGNDVLFGEGLKFVMQCVLDKDPEVAESGDHWAKGYAKKAMNELSDTLSEEVKERIQESIENKEEFKAELTRGEFVQMVVDLLGIEVPSATEAPFSDVSLGHANANAIAYALEKGLVSGDAEDQTFRPDGSLNRAEVAKIILLAKELL